MNNAMRLQRKPFLMVWGRSFFEANYLSKRSGEKPDSACPGRTS
jgi:hypothetical protein